MAVLAKIRQRSVLMIAVIALALIAFLVGDIFNSGGFKSNTKDVGSIDGKDISFEDFRIKVSNVEKSGQGTTGVAAANRVWDQEVSVALLNSEFAKLGLRVGEKHLLEIFKANPNIGQNKTFQNEAGVFDIAKFKEYFKSNPEQTQFLKDSEKDADLQSKYQIYNSLIKASLYTTDAEGKLKYEMEANKANFAYVAGLYSSIKDSDVKITDEEITDFLKKNEKKYKADKSREIQYVLIEDKPSQADENEVKTKVVGLLSDSSKYDEKTKATVAESGFRTTTNNADFVNSNSDIPYDSTYVAKKDLPAVDADKLYNLAPGEVYGPYVFGKYYCISKSLGRKAGANTKVSQILIGYEGSQAQNPKEKRTKEQAKAEAEAILTQINANPESFLMLAFTKSDDSSAQQGGDIGYISANKNLPKPFNDFLSGNGIGKVGIVETQMGFHVLKITDKQDGIRLATIAQKIEASEATSNKVFEQAGQFEMKATEKDFDKTAKTMNLKVAEPVSVKAMDESLGALGNQRNIIRWAFEDGTKVGAIKKFEVANLGYVIAKLKSEDKSGIMSIKTARPMVESILKNKKKAVLITAKMKGNSLEAIAKATNSKVEQAVGITMENPVLTGGVGQEPRVVGNAFALGTNKISAPIEGNTGIYVVKNLSTAKAPALKSFTDYVAKLKAQSAGDINRVLPALKSVAKIEDNRSKFNY